MKKNYALWLILIIPYLLLIGGYFLHKNEIRKIPDSRLILINKNDFTLSLYNYKGKYYLNASFRRDYSSRNR